MKAWVLVLVFALIGCNKKTDPRENPSAGAAEFNESNIYPHPSDFGNSHGSAYRQSPELCSKCHGADLSGGNTKVSCQTCHASFPHQKGWAAPAIHGVHFLKADVQGKSQCANCHGAEKAAGRTTCTSCHASYPHNDEFYAGGHADAARRNDGLCLNCHDRVKQDLPEVGKNLSCTNCHGAGFPHPKGWANPAQHGKFFSGLSEGDRKACSDCHGGGAGAQKACQNCHLAFPHSEDFKGGDHGAVAKTVEGKCTSCHKGLNTNMPNFESCTSCHDGKLDVQIGWKSGGDNASVHPPTKFKTAAPKKTEPRKPSSRQPTTK